MLLLIMLNCPNRLGMMLMLMLTGIMILCTRSHHSAIFSEKDDCNASQTHIEAPSSILFYSFYSKVYRWNRCKTKVCISITTQHMCKTEVVICNTYRNRVLQLKIWYDMFVILLTSYRRGFTKMLPCFTFTEPCFTLLHSCKYTGN